MGVTTALFEATDWTATALGPVDAWPTDMRAIVEMALTSGFPVCTAWGDEGIQIYNDAYIPIFGDKHPAAFGRPVRESWPEIWEFLGPALHEVRTTRVPMAFQDTLLPLAKHRRPEECWFDFSYSAVGRGERAQGVISIAVEKTRDVVLARRHATCDLPLDAMAEGELEGLSRVLGERLEGNPMDAAAAALVAMDPDSGQACKVLLQLGDWPALAEWAGNRATTLSDVAQTRCDAHGRPPQASGIVTLVPLMDQRRRTLAMLALAPNPLVSAEGHIDFAGALSARLQRVIAHADTLGAYRDHIAEQDTLYRFLFENILEAVIYARTDGAADSSEVVVAANPVACEMFGYSARELRGMTRDQLMFPGDAALREALLQREHNGVFTGELTFRRRDGSMILAEVGSKLVASHDGSLHSVNIVRDISARVRQAAEQARQARHEAIAQLTAGIAHDFNNLLTVVQSSLDLMLEDLPEDARGREFAANALLCAERGAALTGQLLAYSRRQSLHLQPEDLNARLRELVPLVKATLGERSQVVLVLDESLPFCRTDTTQLTTAVLNLAANARDAMPQGGTLTLETTRDPQDADMVVLRATDTGHGVGITMLERIFEPYFTTKALGAGLGLAMVQGFVLQSGGWLQASNTVEGGACFELHLPAAATSEAVTAARPPALARTPGGHVLLVEDNPLIRQQTCEMLRRAGYQVSVAADADQAMSLLQEQAPDVLLSDLDMPGSRDGLALARIARNHLPGLPILLMTGHDPHAAAGDARLDGIATLAKPFDRNSLLEALALLPRP